jgi:putative two-component system response regulator
MSETPAAVRVSRILFVDDEQAVLSSLRRLLRNVAEPWCCHYVTSADSALEMIASQPMDVVVSDVNMPGKTGFDLLCELRQLPETQDTPVLIITGGQDEDNKRRALDLGATDLLVKPVSLNTLLARIRNMLKLKEYQDEIKKRNQHLDTLVKIRTRELELSRLDLIWRLGKTAEKRDSNTGYHIFRVAHYCRILAVALGMSEKFCDQIFQTSPLHDIGKIGIPDKILLKPGGFDEGERRAMEAHCLIGAEILSQEIVPPLLGQPGAVASPEVDLSSENHFLNMAADIALCHHEHWDGSGYPRGIAGEAIPLAARICALADVFDALASARPYKEPLPLEQVLEMMRAGRGTQFDPVVFQCFEENLTHFVAVRNRLADGDNSFLPA